MTISEKKNFERKFFKNLMEKSTPIDRKNVEINVKLYVESFSKKGMKIKLMGNNTSVSHLSYLCWSKPYKNYHRRTKL